LPPDRLIVVDATFPPRIASELKTRGMEATSAAEQGAAKFKDPELLELVSAKLEPAVLVTFDNKMLVEHAALLNEYAVTLAVVDGRVPPTLTPEQYWRDVIHRHAHRFAIQPQGIRFVYRQDSRRRVA
jgi:predicted nuclease of predicted toxin-antitoxin system